MTIEMPDKGTILVSLSQEDMRRYAFRPEDNAPQAALQKLMRHVGDVCGLDHRGKSYLVEALPCRAGCLLIITVRAVKRRRIYHIKRRRTRQLCVFFDADAMLDFLREGLKGGYALYRYEGRYVLLPGLSAGEEELSRLSEYGELYEAPQAATARVCEHGALLRQQETQRRHIGGGAVAVRDAALRHAAG